MLSISQHQSTLLTLNIATLLLNGSQGYMVLSATMFISKLLKYIYIQHSFFEKNIARQLDIEYL